MLIETSDYERTSMSGILSRTGINSSRQALVWTLVIEINLNWNKWSAYISEVIKVEDQIINGEIIKHQV